MSPAAIAGHAVKRARRWRRSIALRSSSARRLQHVVDDVLLREFRIARMADADAQAPEIRRAQLRLDVAQSVVARRARRRVSSSPRRATSRARRARRGSRRARRRRTARARATARPDRFMNVDRLHEAQRAGLRHVAAELRFRARTTRQACRTVRRRTRTPRCGACARIRGRDCRARRPGGWACSWSDSRCTRPLRRTKRGPHRFRGPRSAASRRLSALLLLSSLSLPSCRPSCLPSSSRGLVARGRASRFGGARLRPLRPRLRPLPQASSSVSTCARGTIAVATTGSILPRDTTVTPGGSFTADTWSACPTSSADQVHLDEAGQVLRQANDVEVRRHVADDRALTASRPARSRRS